MLDYTREIHAACVQRNVPAVLIEEDLSGPSISLSAVFQIVAERAPEAQGFFKRIALVDLNPEHDAAGMEFAEDVAVNHRINLRLFGSVAAAERWLRELQPGPDAP